MSRHRAITGPSSRSARLLAAPAAGALAATFLAVLVPPAAFAADRNCPDFASQADAQAYFDAEGGSPSNNVDGLDADNDGIACENTTYVTATPPSEDNDPDIAPQDVPQGGVAAGDGDTSGLFRLF